MDRSTYQHLDGLITALVDDPMQFSLEVGNINKEMVFLAVVISLVKDDEPPGDNTLKLIVDKVFDIPCQPLGLLALLLVYLGLHGFNLIFSCFFSRRDIDTNSLASSPSLLFYGSQFATMRLMHLIPPSEHCRR